MRYENSQSGKSDQFEIPPIEELDFKDGDPDAMIRLPEPDDLPKDRPTAEEIDRFETSHREMAKLERENEGLKEKVVRDSLTGLYNRLAFKEMSSDHFALLESIDTQSRQETLSDLSYAVIDIDYFKKINDKYGHQFGDEILQKVGQTIRDAIRPGDIVYRWGGEEFLVELFGADKDGAIKAAEKIRKAVGALTLSFVNDHPDLELSVSIGISSYNPKVTTNPEILFNEADKALYLAKNSGRNKVVAYNDQSESRG